MPYRHGLSGALLCYSYRPIRKRLPRHGPTTESKDKMRLKLVIIASSLAALLGTGLAILLVLFIFSSLSSMSRPGLLIFAIYLLPVLTTLLASIFVYRHTARRRRLQAALTAIVSLLLSLALFFVASLASAPSNQIKPPPEIPRNSA